MVGEQSVAGLAGADRILQGLVIGDVAEDIRDLDHGSGIRISADLGSGFDPDDPAILALKPVLQPLAAVAGDGVFDLAGQPLPIVGMDDAQRMPTHHFGGLVAGQIAADRRHICQATAGVAGGDNVVGVLRQHLETLGG